MYIKNLHLGDLYELLPGGCPRKFYLGKIARLRSKTYEVPEVFRVGIVGHILLQHHYMPEIHSLDSLVKHDPDDVEYCKKLYPFYVKRWQEEDKNYAIMSSEQNIKVTFWGVEFVFTPDMKVYNKQTRQVELFDHKFYKVGRRVTIDTLFESHQPWGYFLMSDLTAQDIKYFTLNVIYKRSFKDPKVLQNGTVSQAPTSCTNVPADDYEQTVRVLGLPIEDYQDTINILRTADESHFCRLTVGRNPGREQYLYRGLVDACQRIASLDKPTRIDFPMIMGYGCTYCEYFRICEADISGGDVENTVAFNYRVKDEEER